jgi:hypothetical protein
MKICLLSLSLLTYRNGATFGYTHHHLSAKNARVRRTRGKGGKGNGSTGDDMTLPPTEEVLEPAGSNDGSHLEHICGLFAEFGSVASTFEGGCDDFDRFKNLMCPDEYEIGKICDSRADNSDTQEAIADEYCGPLFTPLSDVPEEEYLCADVCISFVSEANCCNLSCPD